MTVSSLSQLRAQGKIATTPFNGSEIILGNQNGATVVVNVADIIASTVAELSQKTNAQAVTSYTFRASDLKNAVEFSNALSVTAVLPTPLSLGFQAGAWIEAIWLGAAGGVLTCSGCTLNGLTSVTIAQGQGLRVVTDGTNWFSTGVGIINAVNVATAAVTTAATSAATATAAATTATTQAANAVAAAGTLGTALLAFRQISLGEFASDSAAQSWATTNGVSPILGTQYFNTTEGKIRAVTSTSPLVWSDYDAAAQTASTNATLAATSAAASSSAASSSASSASGSASAASSSASASSTSATSAATSATAAASSATSASGSAATAATQAANATSAATSAAASAYATLYTAPGGQGDRRALIALTVTPSSAYYGTASNILDGLTAHQASDMAFNAVAAAGLALTFDFGINAAKVVSEITWIQTGTQSHGVFQAQVSNDGVTWSAVGATFTLGGATSQVITLTGMTPAFRYLQLLGVSGTMSGGPYISEVQFKIAGTLNDGKNIPAPDGTPGKVLTVQGDGRSFLFSANPGDVYAGMPYAGMLAQWKFNEPSGTQCLDSIGSYPIDLTLPASQNYTRTGRGIQTNNGLIQTPSIPAARMVAMLYRVKRETTGAFLLSGGNGAGNGLLPEGTSTGYTYTVGNGFGVVHPMVFAAAGQPNAGLNTHEIARGGWLLVFVDFNAAYTTALGFGGQYGTTAARCADFELAWAGVWNRSLTSTEQATVYAVLRKVAMSKGLYLSMYDCPRMADAVVMLGESTMSGHGVITDLTAADQALAFKDTYIQPGLRAYATTNYARPHPFELGLNQMIYDPTGATFSAAVNFGPEFGVAYQHRANQLTRTRPLYILKAGLGSTFLSSAYLATSVVSCWSNTDATKGSLYYFLLRMLYDMEQGCRADGIGLNLASLLMMLGLNDASSTTYAPDSATYQGYIASFFSQLQTDLGLAALPKMVLWQAHSPCTGANATALTNVRAGQAAFVTAQGTNAALINTDAYPLFADGVHFTSAGTKTAGIDGYNQTGL